MRQFGQDRIVILEVDLPAEGGDLETTATLLRRGREELSAGNYDGVVQKCRMAIESVQKTLKLKPEITNAIVAFTGSERRTMSKRARALLVSETVLHYAHPAHHVNAEGKTFDYGRRDAAFMMALASAVVANGSGSIE